MALLAVTSRAIAMDERTPEEQILENLNISKLLNAYPDETPPTHPEDLAFIARLVSAGCAHDCLNCPFCGKEEQKGKEEQNDNKKNPSNSETNQNQKNTGKPNKPKRRSHIDI